MLFRAGLSHHGEFLLPRRIGVDVARIISAAVN